MSSSIIPISNNNLITELLQMVSQNITDNFFKLIQNSSNSININNIDRNINTNNNNSIIPSKNSSAFHLNNISNFNLGNNPNNHLDIYQLKKNNKIRPNSKKSNSKKFLDQSNKTREKEYYKKRKDYIFNELLQSRLTQSKKETNSNFNEKNSFINSVDNINNIIHNKSNFPSIKTKVEEIDNIEDILIKESLNNDDKNIKPNEEKLKEKIKP